VVFIPEVLVKHFDFSDFTVFRAKPNCSVYESCSHLFGILKILDLTLTIFGTLKLKVLLF